jgi:hypothetical protein
MLSSERSKGKHTTGPQQAQHSQHVHLGMKPPPANWLPAGAAKPPPPNILQAVDASKLWESEHRANEIQTIKVAQHTQLTSD